MSEVFYRVHWAGCPPFAPEHAWSALWGAVRSEDGTQTECGSCVNGQGPSRDCVFCGGDPEGCDRCDDGQVTTCTVCDGTGWEDAAEGYSCCDTPADLAEYFTAP